MINILNMQLVRKMGKASCFLLLHRSKEKKGLSRLKECGLFCLGMGELRGNIRVVFRKKKGVCNNKRNP